ncbi:velvet factor-domain-containing protein [Truncatella angustata]|uniref:Velvet factor-domain-containing protein n=1 Tax=Truncatella angustata TaxID=152316 RepID=A0A9P8UQX9_9PEZI|nr:velvet factor-domain-containing protein [Truncatella angustata]KAH6656729.1 velvet factor-domain-containing protein [Truncatella angustata]KAH8195032.1 hypothetical protein TruAng_010804 [Truncatella angustata]
MATHAPEALAHSHSRWSRPTRSGKRIHYDLSVIQQPERARACGSGPKSSADRRPVDPPPIVRLMVYEGETFETAKDVTMDYNSDFFLFVSLENARPMAHGRVQTPAATSPPVLTGVPVSACCYLDRPSPAGYFLFPDLSVRHEGRYKLIFRLYERNKDAGDYPVEQSDNMEDDDGLFFTFLNEVRSHPFTVFSAKKFPGLAESTPLSRTVAEQGCRVRIRRDVRMRRRENKAGPTNEYEQREEEHRNAPRTQSPADAYRNRSGSHSSLDRRPSGFEHQPPLAPSNSRVLNFNRPAYDRPYPPAPAPSSEPVSPAAHTPGYRGSFAPPPHPSTPTYSHPYADRQPIPPEERRSSLAYAPLSAASSYGPPIQPRPPIPPIDTSFRRDSQPAPIIKAEPSPTTTALPSASSCAGHVSSSLKSAYEEFRDGTHPGDEMRINLSYRRAGGNNADKESPGYMGEESQLAPIDPQLQAEDRQERERELIEFRREHERKREMEHENEYVSRKRSFRDVIDNH